MATAPGSPPDVVRLFPRRKKDDEADSSLPDYRKNKRSPQLLDLPTIVKCFCFPRDDAARELGISVTTLKQVCRKLGIGRWPGPKKRHQIACQGEQAASMIAEASTSRPASAEANLGDPASSVGHKMHLKCSYQLCSSPTSSSHWHLITPDTRAGDRDWCVKMFVCGDALSAAGTDDAFDLTGVLGTARPFVMFATQHFVSTARWCDQTKQIRAR